MKYSFSPILLACLTFLVPYSFYNSFGQATGNAKEDFLYGEYYLSQGRYSEAIPFYESLLKENSENCNASYRLGLCYSKMIGEQYKALPYLKKAVTNVVKNYEEGNYKNLAAPIECWLLLGDAYHRNNELTNASFAYHKYLELIGNSDEEAKLIAKRKIEGLGISYEFQRIENHVVLMNMGSRINSRFSDYNPVLSGDQKTMVYTQYWESFDQIMITYKMDNKWSTPVSINDQIGSNGDCYSSALSFKGDELFLIRYGDENYNIYTSKCIDGIWTKMTPLNKKINSKYQESSICISSDGTTIYFSSDRPGGEGGFDIYSAEKAGNEWGNIQNLGKTINTKHNEEGPYISYDGTVLYFSSDGHETVGNMDIMYSEIDNEGNWQTPVNMGFPINTTNDDLFYIYFKNTKTGYLSRDLPEGLGKNDIYAIVNDNITAIPEGAFLIKNIVEAKLSTKDDLGLNHYASADSTASDTSEVNKQFAGNESNITEKSGAHNNTTDAAGIGVISTVTALSASSASAVTTGNVMPVSAVSTSGITPISGTSGNIEVVNEETQTNHSTDVSIQPNVSTNTISTVDENKVNTENTNAAAGNNQNEKIAENPISDESHIPTELTTSGKDNSSAGQQSSENSVNGISVQENTENPAKGEVVEVTISTTSENRESQPAEFTSTNLQSQQPGVSAFTAKESNVNEVSDSVPTYTIQIMALKKYKKCAHFKIKPLIVSYGADSLYRYTTGEYKGWSVALTHLEEIRANGYPDAFISNIDAISNYKRSKK